MATSSSFYFRRAQMRHLSHGWLVRGLDVLVAVLLIGCFLPIWSLQILVALIKRARWLKTHTMVGLEGRLFTLARVVRQSRRRPLRWVFNDVACASPALLAVVRGEMSLVGPAPLVAGRHLRLNTLHRERLTVRPGLVHTHFLRRAANLDYQPEVETALLDAQTMRIGTRLGMLVRSLPALAFYARGAVGRRTEALRICGLRLRNQTMTETVSELADRAAQRGCDLAYFVNPACVNIAMRDEAYRGCLDRAHLLLPDGIGIHIAARLLGQRMTANLNGTDLSPRLFERMQRRGLGVYLLGGQPGVCEAMIANLERDFPELRVCGFHHGYLKPEELSDRIADINRSGADVLLVAMGVPRQEFWLDQARSSLQVGLALGVGGLFDFMSGRMPRAPQWLREIGLEWGYRLYQEPRRMWRRYILGNVIFLWHVVRRGP